MDKIVNATLYEGYVLYPYRAGTKSSRQQFKFGRVFPENSDAAQAGAEPSRMQTECLVEGGPPTSLDVTVRFLHPMSCEIGLLHQPVRQLPPLEEDFFRLVSSLDVEGKIYSSGHEAVERTVALPSISVGELLERSQAFPFCFTGFRSIEEIIDSRQFNVGVIVRTQEAVEGAVEITAETAGPSLVKITVRILNQTPIPEEIYATTEEISLRTFASTHTILHAERGHFISLLDPPAEHAEAASNCRNFGMWPVLVGAEDQQERTTMISSPIILHDYPKLAPKPPGDRAEILSRRSMTPSDGNSHESLLEEHLPR